MNTELLAKLMIKETLVPNSRKSIDMLMQIFSQMADDELVLVFCRTGAWKDVTVELYISPIYFGFQYFDRATRLIRKRPWKIA